MKINRRIKPATPWNVTLARLTKLEHIVSEKEQMALEARWSFGRELLSRRVDYKGRLVIPHDLMKLTLTQCKVSRSEVNYRVAFALRYPTKNEMSTAVVDYSSWRQMKNKGLVKKKKRGNPKTAASIRSGPWVVRRLTTELDRAYAHHQTLTRDQVKDIEQLVAKGQAILNQIDRNDEARAS